MNSDFSYLASKCFNFTSKNWSKSYTCRRVSLSVQYLWQSHNLIDFGHFFHFFCKFLTRPIKKRMTTCKISLTPTTKEPKICHALAITSAFNLKLCRMRVFFLDALTNEHTKNFGVSLLLTGRSNYPWCTWNHGSINNSRQCSVYTVQFTVYSIQHAMYTVQYTDSVCI